MMNEKGFSFFELLLVLAILTVVISLVSVNVTNIFTNNNLNVVSKEITTDLNFTQQKAIEESNRWKVQFNDEGYVVFSTTDQNDIIIEKSFSDKEVYLGDTEGNYNPANDFVEFNYDGGLTQESINFIALHNDNDTNIYLLINEVTGKISLHNTIPE